MVGYTKVTLVIALVDNRSETMLISVGLSASVQGFKTHLTQHYIIKKTTYEDLFNVSS